ncbi:helix-turn-helix domain-containing protein [Caulobacter sp. KR2-114]|uniref:helix-turn-helix domain-containing protein n=1 Tax=Caulobacter sp. KR2-114 TaxID=3400912 RepID=UPI003C0CAE8E
MSDSPRTFAGAPLEPDPIDLAIGARLRVQRHHLGLTLQAVAAAADCSHQQLQRYEQGRNRITVSALARLAAALAIPVAALIGDDEAAAYVPAALIQPGALELLAAYAALERADDRALLLRLVNALSRDEPAWPR